MFRGRATAGAPLRPASFRAPVVSKSGVGGRGRALIEVGGEESRVMAEVTIVYWRDIPAQVIAGKGRRGTKRPLDVRFEQAIDRAAMKAGLTGTDAYLSEWRKAPPVEVPGEEAEAAEAEARRIEAEYPPERLRALIDNQGRA
jgi:hypothetical protein